ncbi:MAG: hypothetical protein PWR06_1692 [Thermoanaerobacteraceae bacterium]|nr:hypothetical protein [Thermoanaerobacteraceae bacterium]MDN5312578.1 hypothetical protein [Thermoanaerobacteraceae bacterium]
MLTMTYGLDPNLALAVAKAESGGDVPLPETRDYVEKVLRYYRELSQNHK